MFSVMIVIPSTYLTLIFTLSQLSIIISLDSELFRDELFERCAVPPVLDVILAPRRLEYLDTDFHPSLAELLMPLPQSKIVIATEGEVVNRRIQIIHPPIAYLLPGSSRQLGGQVRPLGERRN